MTAHAEAPSDRPPRPEPIISCRDLVKKFDGRTVLDGITLDVYPGETMVIMGGSGCGKSTLLRLMIGSFRADGGEVRLFGQRINDLSDQQLDDVRKRFGILFQSGALFNSMTVAQNVAPTGTHRPRARLTSGEDQTRTGRPAASAAHPAQISGGMKKGPAWPARPRPILSTRAQRDLAPLEIDGLT